MKAQRKNKSHQMLFGFISHLYPAEDCDFILEFTAKIFPLGG